MMEAHTSIERDIEKTLELSRERIEKEKVIMDDNYSHYGGDDFLTALRKYASFCGVVVWVTIEPCIFNMRLKGGEVSLVRTQHDEFLLYINISNTPVALDIVKLIAIVSIVLDTHAKRNPNIRLLLPGHYRGSHTCDSEYLPVLSLSMLGLANPSGDRLRHFIVRRDLVSYFCGCRSITLFTNSISND